MKSQTLLRLLLAVTLILVLTAAFFKLNHFNWSPYFLICATILSAVFIVAGIYTVLKNHQLSDVEKFVWSAGFLFMWPLAGVVYLFFKKPKLSFGHTAN